MKFEDADIKQLFENVKHDPVFHADFDAESSWKQVARAASFPEDTSVFTHTWKDWVEFSVWEFTHQLMRPMATVAFSVLVFAGGWLGAANASLNALPGDQLYSVKLIMERAQLALATSDAQKAQLRTEFTSRRLEEMVILASSGAKTSSAQLATAVQRAKQDVEGMKTDLVNDSAPQAKELAKAVGRKGDLFSNTVTSSSPTLREDAREQVEEVQTIIDQTKEQAVEVMITAHEQSVTPENAQELLAAFQKAYAHTATIAGPEDQEKMIQAIKLQENGVYRRAFQLLKEIELSHAVTE